jgi:hypothetical protein
MNVVGARFTSWHFVCYSGTPYVFFWNEWMLCSRLACLPRRNISAISPLWNCSVHRREILCDRIRFGNLAEGDRERSGHWLAGAPSHRSLIWSCNLSSSSSLIALPVASRNRRTSRSRTFATPGRRRTSPYTARLARWGRQLDRHRSLAAGRDDGHQLGHVCSKLFLRGRNRARPACQLAAASETVSCSSRARAYRPATARPPQVGHCRSTAPRARRCRPGSGGTGTARDEASSQLRPGTPGAAEAGMGWLLGWLYGKAGGPVCPSTPAAGGAWPLGAPFTSVAWRAARRRRRRKAIGWRGVWLVRSTARARRLIWFFGVVSARARARAVLINNTQLRRPRRRRRETGVRGQATLRAACHACHGDILGLTLQSLCRVEFAFEFPCASSVATGESPGTGATCSTTRTWLTACRALFSRACESEPLSGRRHGW